MARRVRPRSIEGVGENRIARDLDVRSVPSIPKLLIDLGGFKKPWNLGMKLLSLSTLQPI